MSRNCSFVKPDGAQCSAPPLQGQSVCFFHTAAKSEERRAAQSAGGKKHRSHALSRETSRLSLRSRDELTVAVEETVNNVLQGQIDPKIANAVTGLISLQIRLLDQNLEHRVATLENLLARVPGPHGSFATMYSSANEVKKNGNCE